MFKTNKQTKTKLLKLMTLMQRRHNSSADTLQLCLFFMNPSKYIYIKISLFCCWFHTKNGTMTLPLLVTKTGPWFNIKMTSYQYRKSHCGDKTILRPSYLHNGISYAGKITSLYWIRAQMSYHLSSYPPLVTHICVSKLGQNLFSWWLVAGPVLRHYLN